MEVRAGWKRTVVSRDTPTVRVEARAEESGMVG